MDISLAIKSGYFEALSYGLNIPVYDAFAIPVGVSYPYVIIASIQPIEELDSKCKSWDVTVTLDIVTGFTSPKGMKQAYEISGLIEDIINPASRVQIDLSPYGYQIGQTRSNSVPNQFRTDNYWIYRSIKTFSHKVWPI
jgi:hypothetical protein